MSGDEKELDLIRIRLVALEACILELTRIARSNADLTLSLFAGKPDLPKQALDAIHAGNTKILQTLSASMEAANGK